MSAALRLTTAFALVGALILSLAIAQPAEARGRSAFNGAWTSVDLDGSTQYMTIAAGSDGVRVNYQDRYASFCVTHDAGPHATIRGEGTLDANVLEVSLGGINCAGGFSTPPGGSWTLRYDAASDTFTIDEEDWGGESLWERVGAAQRTW